MLISYEKENIYGKRGEHSGYQGYFAENNITSPDGMVCSISQHPVKHKTVSHEDGSLPTYLAQAQKLWSCSRKRWLTAAEKFGSMG